MIASFEFELSVYAVNGNASQPKASATPSGWPPKRRPTRKRPSTTSRSNAIAVACAAGSESHFPLQSSVEHGRHVDDVGGRAVGVAARVRRLAAAVRLDPVADLPSESARPARPGRVLDRHVPVRGLAVEDPVAADHAGVADVDHPVGVLDVEPDAQPAEEDGDGGEQPHRPRERRVEGAAAEADPRGADGEVRERRRPERGRAEDVALVEAPQREAERDEREQVERVPGAQAAPVDEAEDEDDAERDPRPPRVQDLAAERADPAAGHPPGDLRAGPRLEHARRRRRRPCRARSRRRAPTRPAPSTAASPCRTSHRSAACAGSASASPRPSDTARKRASARLLVEARRLPGRARTAAPAMPVVVAVVGPPSSSTARWRRRRRARAAARAPRRTPSASPAERPELVADEVERRHEDDRDRLREDLADARP